MSLKSSVKELLQKECSLRDPEVGESVVLSFCRSTGTFKKREVFVCSESKDEILSDSDDSTAGILSEKGGAQLDSLESAVSLLLEDRPHVLRTATASLARSKIHPRLRKHPRDEVESALFSSLRALGDEEFVFAASMLLASGPEEMSEGVWEDLNEPDMQQMKSLASARYLYASGSSVSSAYRYRYAGEKGDISSVPDMNRLYARMTAEMPEADKSFDQYYWTRSFHDLVGRHDERALEQFGELAASFAHAARMYARVIANEYSVPNQHKSIKPISGIGGVAGGDKYLCAGIFLKFSVDSRGLYGSDEQASKAARHDLRGINVLNRAPCLKHVHVPLACVIDCNGISILATSQVPISGNRTLVYGSSDGGYTIHNDNELVDGEMRELGKWLNLAPHRVGNETLALCGDAEVHRSELSASSFYLLDVARLFPCEPPRYFSSHGQSGSFLIHLLRPELVLSSPNPLCSDAHTAWDDSPHDQRKAHCRDVRAVFDELVTSGLKKVLEFMEGISPTESSASVADVLHTHGFNIRLISLIYLKVKSADWKKVLLAEMVSRSIKVVCRHLLNTHLKNLRGLALNHTFVNLAQTFLASLFIHQDELSWAMVDQVMVVKFYGKEGLPNNLWKDADQPMVYTRLSDMLGIYHTSSHDSSSSPKARIFDISALGSVVHDTDVVQATRIARVLRESKNESNSERRLAMLKDVRKAVHWSTQLLRDYCRSILHGLIEMSSLCDDILKCTEARLVYQEAIYVFHRVYGDTPQDDDREIWMEWMKLEQSCCEKLLTTLAGGQGYSVEYMTTSKLVAERTEVLKKMASHLGANAADEIKENPTQFYDEDVNWALSVLPRGWVNRAWTDLFTEVGAKMKECMYHDNDLVAAISLFTWAWCTPHGPATDLIIPFKELGPDCWLRKRYLEVCQMVVDEPDRFGAVLRLISPVCLVSNLGMVTTCELGWFEYYDHVNQESALRWLQWFYRDDSPEHISGTSGHCFNIFIQTVGIAAMRTGMLDSSALYYIIAKCSLEKIYSKHPWLVWNVGITAAHAKFARTPSEETAMGVREAVEKYDCQALAMMTPLFLGWADAELYLGPEKWKLDYVVTKLKELQEIGRGVMYEPEVAAYEAVLSPEDPKSNEKLASAIGRCVESNICLCELRVRMIYVGLLHKLRSDGASTTACHSITLQVGSLEEVLLAEQRSLKMVVDDLSIKHRSMRSSVLLDRAMKLVGGRDSISSER